jgi:acetyl-CoA C-acetyltransferase
MMTTLVHELRRREGRYGLETMCIPGGQGMGRDFRERALVRL